MPFLDLARTSLALAPELEEDIRQLLASGAFTDGPAVAAFESAFARFVGAAHCVGTASGLDALRLGLVAAGLEPGERVVVPAMTFVATLEAVSQAGGTPVVVDIAEDDYCIDVGAAAAALGAGARAVLPVHLYGQLADMAGLADAAAATGAWILEDACQAHGAGRRGRSAGTTGCAAGFSFYPGKNLGAIGDAGALVTHDPGLAETARALRQHGQREKYVHVHEGYTARLDTIQAIALLRKLPHLEAWNADRRRAAALYLDALDGVGDLVLPPVACDSDPVWHLFVVRTADPAGLAAGLRERGVQTGRHYPHAVHLSPAYARLGHRPGAFPVAERLARECLSLPIFPGLREDEIAYVADCVSEHFAGG